jgi:hypothetical protein
MGKAFSGGMNLAEISTRRIGTGTVQRALMEQPRPFDANVAEAAFASCDSEMVACACFLLAPRVAPNEKNL